MRLALHHRKNAHILQAEEALTLRDVSVLTVGVDSLLEKGKSPLIIDLTTSTYDSEKILPRLEALKKGFQEKQKSVFFLTQDHLSDAKSIESLLETLEELGKLREKLGSLQERKQRLQNAMQTLREDESRAKELKAKGGELQDRVSHLEKNLQAFLGDN